MKYIIIGGVAGGATAAARIRRNDEQAEIILIEKSEHISSATCGMPYYLGDVIREREKLFVQTPQGFAKRFNIDVRTCHEVVSIERHAKKIIVLDETKRQYEESYDKLLLSTGALPQIPKIKGLHFQDTPDSKELSPVASAPLDHSNIFTLRNMADTDRIKRHIQNADAESAIILGGGFIGLEMAENLAMAGLEVTIVEKEKQLLPMLNFPMANALKKLLQQQGIDVLCGKEVTHVETSGNSQKEDGNTPQTVTLYFHDGASLSADLMILSLGVTPCAQLARSAGLECGATGGIKVNPYLCTSDRNIYAAGDVIEFPHPISGEPWCCNLAGPANRQARIAADNMTFDNLTQYEGAIGTAIVKVFDFAVAMTGLGEQTLQRLKMPYLCSHTHSASHAGYYPKSEALDITIYFHPTTGKLYGAQILGKEGVDKRIDDIALIIKRQGSVFDMSEMEQAYAPPFSAAKDPVAMAGYVGENIVLHKCLPFHWDEVGRIDLEKGILLDVRTPEEHAAGAIPNSLNIPLDELRQNMHKLPADAPIYVYCAIGLRGYLACRILLQNGFQNVRNLSGGFKTWKMSK